jgi:acyl carrier protein
MTTFIEPRVRHLVADTLGVGVDQLSPDVSLVDDLAADSLDLTELAVRLEAEFGITVPDRVVDGLRTYGDFLEMALAAMRGGCAHPQAAPELPVAVRTRLVSARGEIVRAELLTPYAAESLIDEALRAGRGARLEITVGPDAGDRAIATLREQLAWLTERGVALGIGRQADEAPRSHEAA